MRNPLADLRHLCGPELDSGNRIVSYITSTIQRAEPTPVSEVGVVIRGLPRTIYLKLDGWSKWGSIKGRTAMGLIGSVANRICDRTTVVESTSGNLGVALAGVCHDLGVPFIAVVDARLPSAMRARMAESGARIVEVETPEDGLHLQHRLARVREIVSSDPDAVWTNQYENPANAAVHRWWTGPELASQFGANLPVMFVPVSTGGTFAGLSSYLTDQYPDVTCVAVDVHGSSVFGGPAGRRVLTGIGASQPSAFITGALPPHMIVPDTDAIATCRALACDAGIDLGGSAGATLTGCLEYLAGRPGLDAALCLCPDLGTSYQDTLYHDGWLRQAGVTGLAERPVVGGEPVFFEKR